MHLAGAFLLGAAVAALAAWLIRRRSSTNQPVRTVDAVRASLPSPASGVAAPAKRAEQPVAIDIDCRGTPLFRISALGARSARGAKPVSANITRMIIPVVERIPSLVANATSLFGNSFQVIVKPELLVGLRDGSLNWMRSREVADGIRLNLVDRSGKIVGQGSALPAGQAAQLLSAGFQLGSFVFAQAHLAQINARLAKIEGLVGDVQAFLKGTQEGELRGQLRYLQERAAAFCESPPSPTEVELLHAQLESIEREGLQIDAAIRLELDRHEGALDALDLDGLMTSFETDRDALFDTVDACHQAVARLHLGLCVRLFATQMRGSFPVESRTLAAVGLDSIERDIAASQERNERLLERIRSRAGELSGAFTADTTIAKARRKLTRNAGKKIGALREEAQQLIDHIAEARAIQREAEALATSGLILEVTRTENGNRIRALSAAAGKVDGGDRGVLGPRAR
jgi:hypothetical protein